MNAYISRLFDIIVSVLVLVIIGPVVALACLAIWFQDFHSPFYVSERIGLNGREFKFYKLRSMVEGADKSGVDSTSANDPRLTTVGVLVRKSKLDEFPQFMNVLLGDMSVVGPRPNVERETRLYSKVELRMLSVRPGITDFSSIVFADLAHILEDQDDANIAYNQLVRPWKSRLSLFYVDHESLALDLALAILTGISLASVRQARAGVVKVLKILGAPDDLQAVASRKNPLVPTPPPGMDQVVTTRNAG